MVSQNMEFSAIVNLTVMEKDAVIIVSPPVLRIRMKQVVQIDAFSTFSGKRFEEDPLTGPDS